MVKKLLRLKMRNILSAEFLSAFLSSSLQNESAVFGAHSFSEAVLLASLFLLGLICHFHKNDLLYSIKNYCS